MLSSIFVDVSLTLLDNDVSLLMCDPYLKMVVNNGYFNYVLLYRRNMKNLR